ncbi:CRISPR-associated protein Csm1 [Candidatus Magnetomoraceae bacterium gMMP-15]
MKKDLEVLILSALLHDIGKFVQRGANDEYLKNVEAYSEKSGPWHVHYTDCFLKKEMPFPKQLKDFRSEIARTASAHHHPDENNLLEMSLMTANCLSNGIKAVPKVNGDEPKEGFRKSRLVPIFDEIELLNHKASSNWFYQLEELKELEELKSSSKGMFPKKGNPNEGKPDDYMKLYKNFLSKIRDLKTDIDFKFYLEGLISVLENYTWCIPSNCSGKKLDVSLFDHLFTTAGIAQSLYCYHKEKSSIPRWEDGENKFILVTASLSGIQQYIFGINKSSGRGVSKIFRARSFFLQAVTNSILLEIQNKLGLFSVCRLVDSASKFMLILPAINSVKQYLESLDNDLQDWFLKKFKGMLTMNFDWKTELCHKDFLVENFQSKINEANENLEEAKYCKLKNSIASEGTVIGGEDSNYDEEVDKICQICGINAKDEKCSKRYTKEQEIEISICSDCYKQITYIGRNLPKINYLIYKTKGEINLFGGIGLSITKNTKFLSQLDDVFHVERFCDDNAFRKVRLARHLPSTEKELKKDSPWRELFIQDDDFKNEYKTFSQIALKSKKIKQNGELTGRSLLGFFKADVDNLGLIFSSGLEGKLSPARFASISRVMNIFFSDYLAKLMVIEKKYSDIYVIFAGGDDMFVVGPWHNIIDFAIELRRKFSLFCAENSDISFSAGILAAKPRLPIRKAADIVEEKLEESKRINDTRNKRYKDSVCFLELPKFKDKQLPKSKDKHKLKQEFGNNAVSWEEFEKLIERGKFFDKAVENHERTNFSTSFLHRLLNYHKMYLSFIREGKIRDGRYLSLAHYDIGRNIQGKGDKNEIYKLLKIFAVGVEDRPELVRLDIPLFYAINRNRD